MDMSKASKQGQARINEVEPTEEGISGRGGLSLFIHYLESLMERTPQKEWHYCFASAASSRRGGQIVLFLMGISSIP